MGHQSQAFDGMRFLVIAAAIVIILYGVNQAQSFMALFLVSVFLALIGTPPVLWLERKRVPSFLAVMIVMAGMVALLFVIGGIVGTSLNALSDSLPFYEKRLQLQIAAVKALLASKYVTLNETLLLEYLNPRSLMNLTSGLLAGMGLALTNIAVILLTVTFILLEASSFPIKIRSALGDPQRAFPQFTRFVSDIKRYMIIKTTISLIAGAALGLWLFILGVDSPFLWGFLAFLLHYIPNLGQIMAAFPPILLAFIQLGVGHALLVAAGYLVVGFTLGNVIEPRLMGRQFGLSTLVVFLSLMFWGALLGPIGVVLCVPLTMTMKFAFEGNPGTRWIAVLLGSERAPENMPPLPVNENRVASVLKER
ncbi:MAG TPA: AI-2E family transporter [Bacteroidota bacterium]